MPTLSLEPPRSLAEVLRDLGDVAPDRIGLPLGTATERDVVRWMESRNKHLYELIDGYLVEKAMGMKESMLAGELLWHIRNYLEVDDLGFAFGPDGPIRIVSDRIRFPDTGFISWDQIPGEEIPDDPILDAVPDLAVEILSKSNTPKEMELKIEDYFKAGVKLVWIIDPKTQTAVVHTPRTRKVIGKDGSLDGGKILPGFSLPLKKLFARTKRSKRKD